MADFTIRKYLELLETLRASGYEFQTFRGYLADPKAKTIILRHDVDRAPENSLRFARIQFQYGIRGTYYFRALPPSFNEKIIREIDGLGHEVGYHYEDMALMARRVRISNEEKLAEVSIKSFADNLERIRKLVPVYTICMHGSPMNRWDSRFLWKYFNYRDYGIEGEPYFDIDPIEVLYLTDTGRAWDSDKYNVRDKLQHRVSQRPVPPNFHNTNEIIRAAESGHLPDRIIMTFHPQRWTDNPFLWTYELLSQRTKNKVKYILIRLRKT